MGRWLSSETHYGGILLIVVGRDANDQYFPMTFRVVETKTTNSWNWFLTLLLMSKTASVRFYRSSKNRVSFRQGVMNLINF